MTDPNPDTLKNFATEFLTVDIVLQSDAETRAVDAFALSLIKAERQLRKLFTHLVFQFPCFDEGHVQSLVDTLAERRDVYFEGVERGFNALYVHTVKQLIGERYSDLRQSMDEANRHRNKIFHGQLTGENLNRETLIGFVAEIRTWCLTLANGAAAEIGYDGFDRYSFRKSALGDLTQKLKVSPFDGISDYKKFICEHMTRP